jgi:hypothetical protein
MIVVMRTPFRNEGSERADEVVNDQSVKQSLLPAGEGAEQGEADEGETGITL